MLIGFNCPAIGYTVLACMVMNFEFHKRKRNSATSSLPAFLNNYTPPGSYSNRPHACIHTGAQVTSHWMLSILPLVSRDLSLRCILMDLMKVGQYSQETKTHAHDINYNYANMKRIFIRKLHYTRPELSHNKFKLRPL